MSSSRRQRAAAVLVVVAVIATGCRSGPEERLQLGDVSLTEAEFLYGRSVEPHPDVTFADDVVVIPGGENAVRAATADGLTWTINPNFRGVDQIEVGKVMFLTSQALGRVHVLERAGDDLVVTILPVELTEVIWEGEFFWDDVTVDGSSVLFRSTGALPWSIVDPGAAPDDDAEVVGASHGTTTQARLAPAALSAAHSPVMDAAVPAGPDDGTGPERPDAPPPTHAHLPSVTVGAYTLQPLCCETGVGLRFSYDAGGGGDAGDAGGGGNAGSTGNTGGGGGGMTLGAKVGIEASALSYSGGFRVAGGKAQDGSVRVKGGEALVYAFVAASEAGITGNVRDEVTLPGTLEIPLPRVAGVPFELRISQKLLLSTGFTARDSYLRADGSFTFTNDIGFDHSGGSYTHHPPQNRQLRSSLLDSVQGQSVGVSGVVLGHRLQFQAALGPSVASAGPYAALVTSIGVTRGSDAGSPLVVCTGVDLNLSLAYGLRYEVSDTIASLIDGLLAILGVEEEFASDASIDGERIPIIERSARRPESKMCQY